MDPITTAILATLPALASDLMKSSVKDAYEGLKAVIRSKWGEVSPLSTAVEALEADPSSKSQAVILEEKIAAAKATEDSEVMKALAELVARLKDARIGGDAVGNINISISGGGQQGVIGARVVKVGTMSFGSPSKPSKD